jgi:probable F420-dependent oxidoreductase
MRELVLAMRAIWACWQDGTKLDFQGEFYRHTLMTPFFDPGPNPFGVPRIFIAAVGGKMTEVTGEVADGMLVHPFTTERYIREFSMPALERGFAAGGKKRGDFELSLPAFIVTGRTDEEMAAADRAVRKQVAFYASTPAYRGVLELHGWGELQPQLNALSKQGDWDGMADLIDDDALEAFAVVAPLDQAAVRLRERFDGLVDRLSFYMPYSGATEIAAHLVAELSST